MSEKEISEKKWTKEHEKLFVEWADKALCYKWLHSKCNLKYNKWNTWFTIPVIVMSTLTGTANFAQEKFPDNVKEYAPMIIGCVNITAGIITTVQQFLKIGELNEAHRVAALSWDKFYRRIKVELSKSPDERSPIEVFLKTCAEEFDRLMEISPNITESVTKKFKNTFQGKIKMGKDGKEILDDKQKAFKMLKKPEICDSLESTFNSIYKAPLILDKANELQSKITELTERKRELDEKFKLITDYKQKFKEQYSRFPTEDEIMENFVEDTENDVTAELIVEYLKNQQSDLQTEIDKEMEKNLKSKTKKQDEDNVKIKIDEVN